MEPNNLNQNNAPAGNPAPAVPPIPQPVSGGMPSAPVAPVTPVSAPTPTPAPAPVNPVVNPIGQPVTQPTAPSPVDIPKPVNPVYQPTNANAGVGGVGTLSATEAIMQPTPPPAPDPVEEELKAPLRPAAPVPGSIGSAVSMPADGASMGDTKNTPSVAFNDPATMDAGNTGMPQAPVKKKMDKKTMITIAILGGMVVVALVAVLVFMMM